MTALPTSAGPAEGGLPRLPRVLRALVLLVAAAFAVSLVPGVRAEPGYQPLFDALVTALRPVGPGCALLYCDLDRFEHVDDTLGHAAGDRLLAEVAARLRASVRAGDLVARVGGDEFLVLCPGADEASLESLATRVREAVAAPYLLPEGAAEVGISVGAHVAPAGASADEVVAAADRSTDAEKRRRA